MESLEPSEQLEDLALSKESHRNSEDLFALLDQDEGVYPRQLELASIWRDLLRQRKLVDFFIVGPDKPIALYSQRDILAVDKDALVALSQYVDDMNHNPDKIYSLSLVGVNASDNYRRYRDDQVSAVVWYLYAPELVQEYLDKNIAILLQNDVPTDVEEFIRYLARYKVTQDQPDLLALVHHLFAFQGQ